MTRWRRFLEQKRLLNQQRQPTYIVERDSPDWEPPVPYYARWERSAIEDAERTRFDAYPDHVQPFDGLYLEAKEDPEALPSTKPHGRTRLMIVGRRHARVVPLAGASLEQMDFTKRTTQGWLADEISRVSKEVVALDDESDKGQGLAEYALILALIAIVAIVALIVLGGGIQGILTEIGIEIGNQPAASPGP